MDSSDPAVASTLQLFGAGAFGALIGWYVYYINRHRREEVTGSDLVSLIGVIGGTAVLNLFAAKTDLFGAYGIGLAAGFFGYFILMALFVWKSDNFNADYFLDGRRKKLASDEYIPSRAEVAAGVGGAMAVPGQHQGGGGGAGGGGNQRPPDA
jgi:hypothetical protein